MNHWINWKKLSTDRIAGRFPGRMAGQMVGQRLMVGFDGTTLTQDLKYLIDTLLVGGIILFSRNIESPDQVAALCEAAQGHARSCGQPPLFIAVDQEGGKVARLRAPFTEFAGNPAIINGNDATYFSNTTARELESVGINMNMAPVLDVALADGESVMADRVFGDDPGQTARLGTIVIDQFQKNRILAVAKHFPGIGRTTLDSHLDRPFLDTAASELKQTDLVPFAAAIRHNVAGMMLSHVVYEKIDTDWPASLSPTIANRLLRKKMGYKGLILTDDLDMGAIKKYYPIETVFHQVITAGIDQALICHRSPNMEGAIEKMITMVSDSPELEKRSRQSLNRILDMKASYLGKI